MSDRETMRGLRTGAHGLLLILYLAVIAAVGACSKDFINYAELRRLEKRPKYFRLPVVFIPGIKGTRLGNVWGYSGHVAGFSGFNNLTLDYEQIAHGETSKFARSYKKRDIYPGEVLMSYVIGWRGFGFHDFVVYRELKDFLIEDGKFVYESDRGRSLFLLSYDWRLDNRIAAVKLALSLPTFRKEYERLLRAEFCDRRKGRRCTERETEDPEIREKFMGYLGELATEYPEFFSNRPGRDPEVKFHLVAHSMGGLVGQYFIARLGGEKDVFNFVTLGTPTKGAMDVLKAFIEGEYPDTLWGNVVGFLGFEKRATNVISISFPSLFQLLPRYEAAVAEGVTLGDLGLDQRPSSLGLTALDTIFETYRQYKAVPDLDAASRALGTPLRPLDEGVIQQHFRMQLLSAACFHAALDGKMDAESEKICSEKERVARAMDFLKEVYSERRREREEMRFDVAPHLERILDSVEAAEMFDRRVVYGGHCTETVTRAKFVPGRGSVEFLGSKIGGKEEAGVTEPHYGDGRVPFDSVQFRRGNEKWKTNFFLCSDHVALVKDDSFKYNLLRTLLSHWEER